MTPSFDSRMSTGKRTRSSILSFKCSRKPFSDTQRTCVTAPDSLSRPKDSAEWDESKKKLALRSEGTLFAIQPEDPGAFCLFLPAATVASEFDRDRFAHPGGYSSRVPIIKSPASCFIAGRDHWSTTSYIAQFLSLPPEPELPSAVTEKVLDALVHLEQKKLLIDLSALLYILEDVVSISLVASSAGVSASSWHNLTMPRDLLRRLLHRHSERIVIGLTETMGKDTIILLVKIVDHIYQGSSCMLYDGAPVVEAYRHVFALRILRLFCHAKIDPERVRNHQGTNLGVDRLPQAIARFAAF